MRREGTAMALLAAAAVWLWWSAAGALADNGSTACLCTGPQCVPPCPTTPQFPFCPPRQPASILPFPWQSPPPKTEFIPQDPGFLAAAAACRGWTAAAWMPVVSVCSAFLVLRQRI